MDSAQETKIRYCHCGTCGEIKGEKEFSKNQRNKPKNGKCRKCVNKEKRREYLTKNRETLSLNRKIAKFKRQLNPVFVTTPPVWYFKRIKRGAEKRGIPFLLTFDEYAKSYKPFCAITGMPIVLCADYVCSTKNQTASLDRIDSSRGYERENIQWVLWQINRMKGALDTHLFVKMCALVYLNNKNLTQPTMDKITKGFEEYLNNPPAQKVLQELE